MCSGNKCACSFKISVLRIREVYFWEDVQGADDMELINHGFFNQD